MGRAGGRKEFVWVVAAIAVLTAGCTQQQAQQPPDETTPSPEEAEAVDLEASTVTHPLDTPYKVNADGSAASPEEGELPAPAGSIRVHWYKTDEDWVALFQGIEADGLCPGTSLQTEAGFEHVSNSPTQEGACEGIEVIASPPDGVRVCDGVMIYVSLIPVDAEGTLFASVQTNEEGGEQVGITGGTQADAAAAPDIDLDAPGYRLPEGFEPAEISC
jgi:hypothetical protein